MRHWCLELISREFLEVSHEFLPVVQSTSTFHSGLEHCQLLNMVAARHSTSAGF